MSDPLEQLGRGVASAQPDVGAIKARAQGIQRRRRVLVSSSAVAIAAIALAGVVLRPGMNERQSTLAQSSLASPTPHTEFAAAGGIAPPTTAGTSTGEATKRASDTAPEAAPPPAPQEQKAMAATAQDSSTSDALEVTVTATDVAGPRSVRFVLQACNRQPHQISRTFNSGQRYDFDVSRGDTLVWRWSDGMAFTQDVGEETWAPNTCKNWSATWNGTDRNGAPAPTGSYQVVGALMSSPKQSTAPRTFCLDLC